MANAVMGAMSKGLRSFHDTNLRRTSAASIFSYEMSPTGRLPAGVRGFSQTRRQSLNTKQYPHTALGAQQSPRWNSTRPRSTTLPIQYKRHSSHSPLGVHGGTGRKKVTLQTLSAMYRRGEPITMITAHDFPSGHVADHAGMDMVLVGDSLAMVALGMDDTSEVVLEEMLLHCRSVSRGAKSPFIVGDLPMGSYELSPEQALTSAIRFIKEGRVQAVKLEGGAEMAPTIRKITMAGIPVLAHVGLTPQRQHSLGGFKVQGKTQKGALKLLQDAEAVQDAGAFAMVMEAVPQEIAAMVTQKLKVPTIGIGAGNGTSGQVLVQIDMNGNYPPGRFLPKFVKKYGDVWGESLKALEAYGKEVKSRDYPAKEHTYAMDEAVLAQVREQFGMSDTPKGKDS